MNSVCGTYGVRNEKRMNDVPGQYADYMPDAGLIEMKDNIRVNPSTPCHPCSILYPPNKKQ